MAQYGGYPGGYVPNTGYSQASQYQTTAGIASSTDYPHGGVYGTGGALPANNAYTGLPGTGPSQRDNASYPNSDSMTPDPSSGTLTNATPAYTATGQAQSPHEVHGLPGAMANPGIGNSPSPANDANHLYFRWWIPSEGISRAVLQRNIQHWLGRDAVARPGPGRGNEEGVPGFWISADQTFTTNMIRDMKEQTLKEEKKRRRDDRDFPYDRRDDRRDDRKDDRKDDRRYDKRYDDDRYDRDSRYDRRDTRDPRQKSSGITPPPHQGPNPYDRRDRRYDDYNPGPQQPPFGAPGFPQYPNQTPAYSQAPSYPPTQPFANQNPQYPQYGNPTGGAPPTGYPGYPTPGAPYAQGGYSDPRAATTGYAGGYSSGAQQPSQYPSTSGPPNHYLAADGNWYPNQY